MKWIEVESANLLKFKYHPRRNELAIVFRKRPQLVYVYSLVPRWVFDQLRLAGGSPGYGEYFHANIKPNYEFNILKVGELPRGGWTGA